MSNKLKTLSPSQLEQLIAEKLSNYLDESCVCEISNLSTPNVENEENIALHDKRSISFEVRLEYSEEM